MGNGMFETFIAAESEQALVLAFDRLLGIMFLKGTMRGLRPLDYNEKNNMPNSK
jgi:hypothetical protein